MWLNVKNIRRTGARSPRLHTKDLWISSHVDPIDALWDGAERPVGDVGDALLRNDDIGMRRQRIEHGALCLQRSRIVNVVHRIRMSIPHDLQAAGPAILGQVVYAYRAR